MKEMRERKDKLGCLMEVPSSGVNLRYEERLR
jgi:hypothetical protein